MSYTSICSKVPRFKQCEAPTPSRHLSVLGEPTDPLSNPLPPRRRPSHQSEAPHLPLSSAAPPPTYHPRAVTPKPDKQAPPPAVTDLRTPPATSSGSVEALVGWSTAVNIEVGERVF